MLKVAMLATALLVAVSTAAVEGVAFEPAAAPASRAVVPSRPGALAGVRRARVDADGDGTISAAELANLAAPPALAVDCDVAARRRKAPGSISRKPPSSPARVLRSSLDRERPQPLIPALVSHSAPW